MPSSTYTIPFNFRLNTNGPIQRYLHNFGALFSRCNWHSVVPRVWYQRIIPLCSERLWNRMLPRMLWWGRTPMHVRWFMHSRNRTQASRYIFPFINLIECRLLIIGFRMGSADIWCWRIEKSWSENPRIINIYQNVQYDDFVIDRFPCSSGVQPSFNPIIHSLIIIRQNTTFIWAKFCPVSINHGAFFHAQHLGQQQFKSLLIDNSRVMFIIKTYNPNNNHFRYVSDNKSASKISIIDEVSHEEIARSKTRLFFSKQ